MLDVLDIAELVALLNVVPHVRDRVLVGVIQILVHHAQLIHVDTSATETVVMIVAVARVLVYVVITALAVALDQLWHLIIVVAVHAVPATQLVLQEIVELLKKIVLRVVKNALVNAQTVPMVVI